MLKKEIIWREIIYQATEKNNFNFQQQKIAQKFSFSLSTVHNALKIPKEIKAVQVSGKGFRLVNAEKLLYMWGTQRKLGKDIIYQTFVSQPVERIEANMPAGIIWAGYSAYKYRFGQTPADYDKIFVYAQEKDEIQRRFPAKKGPANLFVLTVDKYLSQYENMPLGQIFVDIWNLSDWYAPEFLNKLKEKMGI